MRAISVVLLLIKMRTRLDSYANLPCTCHGRDKTREHQLAVRNVLWIHPLGLGVSIVAVWSILAASMLEHILTHFSLVLLTHLWCWRSTTMDEVGIVAIVSSSTAATRTAWRSLLLLSLAKAVVKDSY